MTEKNQKPHIPLWKHERYLLGELPIEEMERLSLQLSQNADLRRQQQRIKEQYAAFDAAHPSGVMIRGIRDKLASGKSFISPKPWLRSLTPAIGLLTLLVLIPFGLRMHSRNQGSNSAGLEETRLKGLTPELFLYRKTGEETISMVSGEQARPSDLIQILYSAAGMDYGAIISVDGEGHVTFHLPERSSKSVLLTQGTRVPLDFSFELDAACGPEDFYFITSKQSFDLDTILPVLLASREDSSTYKLLNKTITRFTLIKEIEL